MKTPVRTFRIEDKIYGPALAKAERLGVPLSLVVRTLLVDFVDRKDGFYIKK